MKLSPENYYSDELLTEMEKKKLDEVTEVEKDDGVPSATSDNVQIAEL